MTPLTSLVLIPLVVLLLPSCAPTSQESIELELKTSGSPVNNFAASDSLSITLTQSDAAFGPLYLCPGNQAGHLCDTARMQWLESAVVDTLDEESKTIGILKGFSGETRSWMYDHGIASLLTQKENLRLSAVEELGGYSIVLQGHAQIESLELPFSVHLIVQQGPETEQGLPVIRKSQNEEFVQEITHVNEALHVQFDPANWLVGLRTSDFIQDRNCLPFTSPVVCAQQIELRCSPEGMVAETRDCSETNQVCAPFEGCVDTIEFKEESAAYRSIQQRVIAGKHPDFTFQ